MIASADRAARSRCFITGIAGNWTVTSANGTVQPYAEIYYAADGVHLHVASADARYPVSAYASCIQLRP